MLQKLLMFLKNKKMWITLGSYFLFALLLSFIMVMIDNGTWPLEALIPPLFFTSVDLAKQILSMLSGVLLTITTFTFSTILVVLTTYSSQFSPRVVENFLMNKITMKVLGIYVGGFFYCITTLLFLREKEFDALVLSATVGVLYSMLCTIYFVIFVYNVSSSIQANNLLGRLYDDSNQSIRNAVESLKDQERVNSFQNDFNDVKFKLISQKNGYVVYIDFNEILNLTKDVDCQIIVDAKIGDFISENQTVGNLFCKQADLDEKIINKLSDCISVENERLAPNDYRFSLQKMIEVALRAISPGINDPYTAIRCLRLLGVLLGKLSQIDGQYTVFKSDESKTGIFYECLDFQDDIFYTFHQIVHYGKMDISVVLALFEALEIVGRKATPANQSAVIQFKEYVYSNCISYYDHKIDIDQIELRYLGKKPGYAYSDMRY